MCRFSLFRAHAISPLLARKSVKYACTPLRLSRATVAPLGTLFFVPENHGEKPNTQDASVSEQKRLVLESGPALSNLDAAVRCSCSCHPRPPDASFHAGGSRCPCQKTKEERSQDLRDFFSKHEKMFDQMALDAKSEREDADNFAVSVGVSLMHFGGAAPFVISGIVDGHGFYLRERHDSYSVSVSLESGFSRDLWLCGSETPSVVVASGYSDDLWSPGGFDSLSALKFTIKAVRLHLLRQSCLHESAGRFCPSCGLEMSE